MKSSPMSFFARKGISCIVFFLVLAYAASLHAEVFQYFDDEGTLIVTDNPYGVKRPRASRPLNTYTPKPDQQVRLDLLSDVEYDYYPVYGRNFAEVVRSVDANGPYDEGDGRRYAGQTRWTAGWSYSFASSYRQEGGFLRAEVGIRDMQFKSNISVLLPMLSPETTLPPQDFQQWQYYMTRLLAHEHDHVRIIRDTAFREEAQQKFSAIREVVVPADPGVDPDALIRQAVEARTARIGHELIIEIKNRNDEYDRMTDHGARPEMRAAFFGGR
ncbi:MAG: DUF922 domain-containing protein [Nitrospiraceae bacterium]|nr:DUF922 domain-containing protein [Nitrospiraceae bacterium]